MPFNLMLNKASLLRNFSALAAFFVTVNVFAGPGAIDTTFNVNVNGTLYCTLVQPSGKILIGGQFSTVGGIARYGFARLNPDGSLDTTVTNSLFSGGTVYCMLVQPDGKFVLGGSFSASGSGQFTHNNIIRLNPDGTVDGSFTNSAPNNPVYAVGIQTDGKILIGGAFNFLAGSNRFYIARLNTDGTVDNSFNAGTISGGVVNAIAVQGDGNILIGGSFSTFSTYGVTRNNIARLTTNGTPDLGYVPTATSTVQSVYLEPGGKSVWGGIFSGLDNFTREHVGRLNTDGTLDGGFTANTGPSGTVYAVAEDANDEIYVAGQFPSYNGLNHEGVARVFSDGTLDSSFNNTTNFSVPLVRCVAIQGDGRVIVGGQFTTWATFGRTNLVRLYGNNYPAEITTQPQSANIAVGATATFSVDVSNPTLVDYQWYYNGWAIPGATYNEYSVFNAQLDDAGTYSVYVNTGLGGTTSSNAVLQVAYPPTITQLPTNMIVIAGQNVTNTVVASGTPLNYAWKFGVTLLSTNATVVISNVTPSQAGTYTLIVSNFAGSVSTNISMTVLYPVNITGNPLSQNVTVGTTVFMSVQATGNPLLYQWFDNGSPIGGATSATYSIPSAALTDSGVYSVTVSNQFNSTNSSNASLLVGIPPQNLQIRLANRMPMIQMPGTPGFPYTIQVATNLLPPVWQTIGNFVADTNGVCSFVDTNAVSAGARFYQAVAP